MQKIFPLFLLVMMTLNVTFPLMEQLRRGDLYELNADEVDGKGETEKEKEKEIFANSDLFAFTKDVVAPKNRKKSFILRNDRPISELHASLPKRPPQAWLRFSLFKFQCPYNCIWEPSNTQMI